MHRQDFNLNKNYGMHEDVPGVSVAFGKDYQKTSQSLQLGKTCLCFIQTYTIYLIQKPVKRYHCLLLLIPFRYKKIPRLCEYMF